MSILYNEKKTDLPVDQLYELFASVGWTSGQVLPDMLKHFNKPFINSTLVVSAWDGEHLVGTVRVLSDKIIRSVIYDLVVLPEYQGKGIGRELVKRCIAKFPSTEWLVQTTEDTYAYYQKMGFKIYRDVVLTIPSIYQSEAQQN